MEICQSLKLCGTHLPILLIFPIARKYLLIVSCDTFNASANCCWVWVGSSSSAACIPCLCTWSTRNCTVFRIEIAIFKLSKACLTCSNQWSVFTTSKWWLSTAFFFLLNKKSNVCCKCCFTGTNFDMITGQYITDTIVRRTELVHACRLMPGAQTDIVSNSYTKYCWVGPSLGNTLRDTSASGILPYSALLQ